jgi:hypothetical protein
VTQCQYCGARHELVGRDETQDRAAAEQAATTSQSESERIAHLRQQDDAPLLPPASLQHYLAPGETTLRRERLDEAQKDWLLARQQLAQGGAADAERLFHLTQLIAPELDERRERALLETAVELLPDARHRQLLRRRLVHRAVLAGDSKAAEAWLAPCNPKATELHMDTAYRLAASYVALAQGDHAKMLSLLGQHAEDLPIAEGSDTEAAVLRAHGLERSGLGSQAVQALVQACRPPTRFGAMAALIDQNAPLQLCPASWPAARERLWTGVRLGLTAGPSPHYALFVAYAVISTLVVVGVLIGNLAIAFEPVSTIVLGIVAIVLAALAVGNWREHRDHVALNAQGELAFARAVSITQKYRQVKPPGSQVAQTKVDQLIDVVIETAEGPVEGTYPVTMNEPPALGVYPCLYHPARPGSLFRLRVGPIDA